MFICIKQMDVKPYKKNIHNTLKIVLVLLGVGVDNLPAEQLNVVYLGSLAM